MIYWIASYPKSGNTWMRLFLSAYRHGAIDINNPITFAHDDLAPGNHQPLLRKPVSELTNTEYLFVRPAMILQMMHAAGNGRVFLKTHHAVCSIDEFPLIPHVVTEGAIYMVRDPREVAISYAKHCDATIDETIDVMENPQAIATTGNGLYHMLATWSNHVDSWADAENGIKCHVVRYEDLHRAPHKAFKSVIEALGWEYSEDRLHATIHATGFDKLQAQEQENGFRERSKRAKEQFFRAGNVDSWRHILTKEQVQRIEQAHGEAMTRMGYQLEETQDHGSNSDRQRVARHHGNADADRQDERNGPVQECG